MLSPEKTTSTVVSSHHNSVSQINSLIGVFSAVRISFQITLLIILNLSTTQIMELVSIQFHSKECPIMFLQTTGIGTAMVELLLDLCKVSVDLF